MVDGLIQVGAITSAGALGLAIAFLVKKVQIYFAGNCFLNAKVNIQHTKVNNTLSFDSDQWPSTNVCDFATFEGVAVSIVAFILLWFYVHMDR
jgi:hypothetical protein